MARTLATLPEGSRITDYVSLGVITKTFPLERVRAVLASTLFWTPWSRPCMTGSRIAMH